MAINKFQRSMLTFHFSAKVAHIGVPSTHQNTVSSETTWPFELKFHMKTAYDRLAKIYTNCSGHMTKMATTPKYGKNPLNVFLSGTKRPKALGVGKLQRDVGRTRYAQLINLG